MDSGRPTAPKVPGVRIHGILESDHTPVEFREPSAYSRAERERPVRYWDPAARNSNSPPSARRGPRPRSRKRDLGARCGERFDRHDDSREAKRLQSGGDPRSGSERQRPSRSATVGTATGLWLSQCRRGAGSPTSRPKAGVRRHDDAAVCHGEAREPTWRQHWLGWTSAVVSDPLNGDTQ